MQTNKNPLSFWENFIFPNASKLILKATTEAKFVNFWAAFFALLGPGNFW